MSVPLGDVAEVIAGQSPPGDTYNRNGDGLPFFQGKADFGPKHPVPRMWCTAPQRVALPGDVLVSVRAPVGPSNVADVRSCIGRGLAAVRARPGLDPTYLWFFLRSQERELAARGSGSTFSAITRRDLEFLRIPLPSEDAQRRIVARLSEYLATVNRATTGLAVHEHCLTDLRAQTIRSEFESPSSRAWFRVLLGSLIQSPMRTGLSGPATSDGNADCLSLGSVRNGVLDLSKTKRVTVDLATDRWVLPGKFYVVRGNGSLDFLARGAFAPELASHVLFPDLLIEIDFDPAFIRSDYLLIAWNTDDVRSQIVQLARTSAGIHKVNLAGLSKLLLPVPDLETQSHVASRLRGRLGAIDRAIEASETRIAAIANLERAVLRDYFGENGTTFHA